MATAARKTNHNHAGCRMSVDARSRAAELLKVPVEATAEKVTSAFLVELTNAAFVPSSKSVASVNTLLGMGLPVDAENRLALSEEVEEFAERYWTLAPADRLAAWLALSTRSPDDLTANRLLTLQAGLDQAITPYVDSSVEKIAAITRELYVLPPRERAIRRNEWLLANSRRHRDLILSAAEIHENNPGLAALDPTLFARLTPAFNANLFAEAATASIFPEKPFSTPKPIEHPAPLLPASPASKYVLPKLMASARQLGSVAGRILIAIISVLIWKTLFPMGGNNSPNNPPYYPKSQLPDLSYKIPESYLTPKKSNGDSLSRMIFMPEEVEAFKAFDKGNSKPMPNNYRVWVLMGKPEAFMPIIPNSSNKDDSTPSTVANPKEKSVSDK